MENDKKETPVLPELSYVEQEAVKVVKMFEGQSCEYIHSVLDKAKKIAMQLPIKIEDQYWIR